MSLNDDLNNVDISVFHLFKKLVERCIVRPYLIAGSTLASWTSSSIITALEAPLHGVCDLMITGHHDGSVTLAAFTASGIIPNPIRHAGRQDGKKD